MKVLIARSSHKKSNKKETNSIFRHFCPGLPGVQKVDPPPSGAPWATYYMAK